MIHAENLSFGFPEKDLFNHIDFTLEPGRHCALIGSNGAGKTTLAQLIYRPEDFLYEGRLVQEDVGRIGFVSQLNTEDKERELTVLDYLSEEFVQLQAQIDEVCLRMGEAEDLDAVMEEYQQLLDESEALDADHYEVNIRLRLHQAGLEEKAELALSQLSGGEYKLVQVIRQMLRLPDLLIMDEPDAFLDFDNLKGLRELINAWEGALLAVTHSRYLLNHCFNCIWHLENSDLQEYDGSFQEYNHARLQEKIDRMLTVDAEGREIERTTELVERLRKEATEVADPQKGRALKGKVSYLNRLEARRIKAPFVEIRQPEIRMPESEPAPEGAVLLQVEDYRLAFDETLLENVSFSVHAGEKIALVGPNGTGKTSMLREIWRGGNPAVRLAPEAKPGFFSQLHGETLNEKNTIYKEFYDLGMETPSQVEAHLARYCFDPDGLDRRIAVLSGGEKNLLQLAKLERSGANLLLLDEPSSHLDTFAQIALEDALADWPGAVLMVSHDFYSIVNCADTILFVEDGGLRPMSGRAFRKMIYKRHFDKDYLELERQKKELETRVARCLEGGDTAGAQKLCDKLGEILGQL